jgi:hypothetical protein
MMDVGDRGDKPGYIVFSSAGGVDVAIGDDSSSRHPESQRHTLLDTEGHTSRDPAGLGLVG